MKARNKSQNATVAAYETQKTEKPSPKADVILQSRAPDTPKHDAVPAELISKLRKVTSDEIARAYNVRDELQESPTFDQDLCGLAPPREQLLEQMDTALKLYEESIRAQRWLDYVNSQRLLAWDTAAKLLAESREVLEIAQRRNPRLAEQYKHLAGLSEVREAIAQRALSTRAANKARNTNGNNEEPSK